MVILIRNIRQRKLLQQPFGLINIAFSHTVMPDFIYVVCYKYVILSKSRRKNS